MFYDGKIIVKQRSKEEQILRTGHIER